MVLRGFVMLGVWKSIYFYQKIHFLSYLQHLLIFWPCTQKFLISVFLELFSQHRAQKTKNGPKLGKCRKQKLFETQNIDLCLISWKMFFWSVQKFLSPFLGWKTRFGAFWSKITCLWRVRKKKLVQLYFPKIIKRFL